jgi:hypothetical protein
MTRCPIRWRSSYPPVRLAVVLSSIIACVVAVILACDSVNGHSDCDKPVSSNLKKIMYWGTVSADQDEPNQGMGAGDIFQPIWYRTDRILIRSARVDKGVLVRGIFEVSIDSLSLDFKSVDTYAFPFLIRDFDYDATSQEFAIVFSRSANDIQVVRARRVGSNLAVVDTVLGQSWHPRSARYEQAGGDLIAYASNPITQVSGFYYVNTPGTSDSVIVPILLPISDARGFDTANGKICYGVTTDSNGFETQIWLRDFRGNQNPVLLAHFPGAFVSATLNATATCAIVSTEVTGKSPGVVVRIVDLLSGASQPVDVKTHPCGFVIADFSSWSPSETSFAFSASAFTGEGDVFPRELWARRNTACP